MIILESERFRKELRTIALYIREESPQNAVRFVELLKARIDTFVHSPYRYRRSIYFDDEQMRDMVYKGYTVVYEIDEEKGRIVLLGIFNRNLPDIEEGGEEMTKKELHCMLTELKKGSEDKQKYFEKKNKFLKQIIFKKLGIYNEKQKDILDHLKLRERSIDELKSLLEDIKQEIKECNQKIGQERWKDYLLVLSLVILAILITYIIVTKG